MRKDNLYSLLFAALISAVSALILAGAVEVFKERQERNFRLDVKKNILKALQIPGDLHDHASVESLYAAKVREFVISPQGDILSGVKPSQVREGDASRLPVYQYVENGVVQATCIPISGKGLWSTIYGYLALANDFNTVRGISFYKQGETAGLGAEIVTDWFQNNWKGKKILDHQGNLVSIQVKKGKVTPGEVNEEHLVDGISGATMTGNGINHFLLRNLKAYENFFKKGREHG